jgi:putative DNA primase/helicase
MPIDAADGSWPQLLMDLGGLTPEQLTNTHQPCPACGGADRYRWDRDDGPGGWFCNQCGGKDHAGGAGGGIDLLTRVTGWSFADACRRVEAHLGITTTTPIPEPPIAGAEHVWRYSTTFYVCRFPEKRIRPLHYDGTAWRWKAPPSPRPLYWARRRAAATVVITEGEKAADAAATLFPDHAIATWPSGCKAIDKADWSPLRGRAVILWPDADAVGREAMAKLAARLLVLDCTVQVVNLPPAVTDGWDLADALAEGWTSGRAATAVKRFARTIEPPSPTEPPPAAAATESPPPAETVRASADPIPGAPFTCLGFDGDQFFYLPHSTGQVTRIIRGSHTGTPLVSLAPIAYWETIHPSKSGVNWHAAASALFEQQAAIGVFDPDRIRGRGAWLDDGRVVFHLGDRIIVDGIAHSVLRPPPTRYYYEQARHLNGPSDAPLSDDDAIRIKNIAERFRWEVPASAHFLAGWMVLAPVCGALSWRPHIWVTGGAGTGKTTILKSFMRPLMGGVLQTATGGTTEPGLRGILKSDAIPVVFDEFEQNEAKDKQIVQNVLALARIASSEGGKIYKGTTTGGAIGYEIRSMFCVSSINVSLINKADIDRFCVLGLRKDPMDKGQWLEFEQEIQQIATVQNGRALIARTLIQLPTIAQNARTFAQALGKRFGQRFGDQHGTLLAGAWSLEIGGGGPVDLATADQWIATMDWEHQQHDAGDADELKCRDTILQQIVRYGGGLDASLGEMVQAVATQQSLGSTVWDQLVPILGRYGIKVFRDGQKLPDGDAATGHFLAVANGNAQLDQLLRATPWSNGAYRSALRRISGALTPGKPTHFAGIGAKRSTLIPITADDLAA